MCPGILSDLHAGLNGGERVVEGLLDLAGEYHVP
jgi:hypothetical protein